MERLWLVRTFKCRDKRARSKQQFQKLVTKKRDRQPPYPSKRGEKQMMNSLSKMMKTPQEKTLMMKTMVFW